MPASNQSLTLDKKIKIAQKKIRDRILKRNQIFEKEIVRNKIDQSQMDDKRSDLITNQPVIENEQNLLQSSANDINGKELQINEDVNNVDSQEDSTDNAEILHKIQINNKSLNLESENRIKSHVDSVSNDNDLESVKQKDDVDKAETQVLINNDKVVQNTEIEKQNGVAEMQDRSIITPIERVDINENMNNQESSKEDIVENNANVIDSQIIDIGLESPKAGNCNDSTLNINDKIITDVATEEKSLTNDDHKTVTENQDEVSSSVGETIYEQTCKDLSTSKSAVDSVSFDNKPNKDDIVLENGALAENSEEENVGTSGAPINQPEVIHVENVEYNKTREEGFVHKDENTELLTTEPYQIKANEIDIIDNNIIETKDRDSLSIINIRENTNGHDDEYNTDIKIVESNVADNNINAKETQKDAMTDFEREIIEINKDNKDGKSEEKENKMISAETQENNSINYGEIDTLLSDKDNCISDVIYAPVIEQSISESKINIQNCDEQQDTISNEQTSELIDFQIIENVNVGYAENNDSKNETIESDLAQNTHLINTVDSKSYDNSNNTKDEIIDEHETKLNNEVIESANNTNIKSEEIEKNEINTVNNSTPMNPSNLMTSSSLEHVDFIDTSDNNTKNNVAMDLETAAITIQKVFRTFLFKSRTSTLDDIPNYEDSIDILHIATEDTMTEIEKEGNESDYNATGNNKERRTLGLTRMDTVLQTVNEEKSLSLSTDDSSTLSSAATTIQAHVRGYLVRNKFNSNKTSSTNSLVNSEGPSATSTELDNDLVKRNKTVLNIHIVPEGGQFISRDESMAMSVDLSSDMSPPSSNLHPLGYDKNERRKQLKREDAIQSVSPPSNNSGKLSEDVDSVKELPINNNDVTSEPDKIHDITEEQHDTVVTECNIIITNDIPTKNTIDENVVENSSNDRGIASSPDLSINEGAQPEEHSTIISSDELDVVTPFTPSETSPRKLETSSKLLHSGEFHDLVLPTRVSRNESSVVRGE